MKRPIFLILLVVFSTEILSNETKLFNLVQFSYQYQAPLSSIKSYYPDRNVLSGGFQFGLSSSILLGIKSSFAFSGRVNSEELKLPQIAIATNGNLSNINHSYRSYQIASSISILKNLYKSNYLFFELDLGYLEYKTQIAWENSVPFLENNGVFYYDGLSSGLFSELFIGYGSIRKKKGFSHKIGLVYQFSATKNRRGIYLPFNQTDFNYVSNHYIGVKIAFLLPLWKSSKNEIQYFKEQ